MPTTGMPGEVTMIGATAVDARQRGARQDFSLPTPDDPDEMRKLARLFPSLNDPGWGRNQQGGGDNQRPGNNNQGDGPPDLDELWRDLNRRLNGMFGRGGRQGPPTTGGEGPTMRGAGIGLAVLLLVALLLWLGSGFYIIQEGQSSIVLRFGQFTKQIDQAGVNWRFPYPIESNELVNTQQLRTVEVGYRNEVRRKTLRESLMLTLDQSIVDIQFAMQYRISRPADFLFNNRMTVPEEIVRQAGEAAMREIVGRTGIDQVLFEEKEDVARRASQLVQDILDRYGAGVTIVDVTIQQVQPPEQVQEAFEDANKAAQDRERLINEGQAYANDVIPRARGAAARIAQEAEGYKASVTASAQGDATRFNKLLAEYSKAPEVTRDRLYIETMQQVLGNTSKLLLDSPSNSLLYLPVDRLMGGRQGQGAASDASDAAQAAAAASGEYNQPVTRARDRDAMRLGRDRELAR
ncbi:MAG: FtsH protease activity modulator HflK [Burkholderiaceae bacterium]